jgi:hypothetical protein
LFKVIFVKPIDHTHFAIITEQENRHVRELLTIRLDFTKKLVHRLNAYYFLKDSYRRPIIVGDYPSYMILVGITGGWHSALFSVDQSGELKKNSRQWTWTGNVMNASLLDEATRFCLHGNKLSFCVGRIVGASILTGDMDTYGVTKKDVKFKVRFSRRSNHPLFSGQSNRLQGSSSWQHPLLHRSQGS